MNRSAKKPVNRRAVIVQRAVNLQKAKEYVSLLHWIVAVTETNKRRGLQV